MVLEKGPIRALQSPKLKSGSEWTIYVVGGDTLYAVAPNGTEKWMFSSISWPEFPFVACPEPLGFGSDGTIYLSAKNLLYALNPDGTIKWKFDAAMEISWPHVGRDGGIYVEGSESTEEEFVQELYAVKPDGTLKWQFLENEGLQWMGGLSLGADGSVYAEEGSAAGGEILVAISPDGSEKWHFGVSRFELAFGADGTIYVVDNLSGMGVTPSGTLYALTPSGDEKWRLDQLCTQPPRPTAEKQGHMLSGDKNYHHSCCAILSSGPLVGSRNLDSAPLWCDCFSASKRVGCCRRKSAGGRYILALGAGIVFWAWLFS